MKDLSRKTNHKRPIVKDDKSRHGHHGVKGGGRTRGKRKMLGDIDAVEEAPELSESLTPSTSSSVSNSTETSSSLSLKTSGQNKKHLLGSIRMPKTQYSDLSTPEVVITPEDDSDGPFRLMFDSDDDIFSTEPNSPDNGGVDLMAAPRQMATSILNQNNDSKNRPTMKKSNSADMPSSKRSSPVYKATDIVETFLDTLRKGCSERQRHHSGSSITRVQSMDQAVLRETSKLQNHQSRPLGEWSFDKSFLTKFTDSPLPSFNTVASVADQKKSSARLFTNGKGSPLSHLTASAIKTTGNIFKTLNEEQADVNTLTCPQCNSFVSFRGEEKLHCEKCLPHLDTSKEGNTSHDSKGEIKSALFPIDLQNFDKEFINHVTEVYDSKNMKFNGQFRSHRGSASFDFSDFQPKHKITWSQHKDFSAERKLRKSITLPFKSVSERMLFGHLSTPLDSKDLDLMKGLRHVDSTGSSESLKVVEEEDSGCKEDESLAEDVQTEEVSLVSRDRTSTGLPEFSDRCRSDGEVDSDVVSRRDNLAKTKKWNTFDVESWNQDVINRNGKGRFINIFYGGEEKNNTENFEQNPEEDEILQIVIESKRQKERADDNNDNDSPCAESLISMQTEGASSKSLEESYQTSDENSPSLTLMESQRDASEGRREELVGVSPFSGLSIKSGNSDWSETDDVAAGKNGFYLKDRDATRRFFLKGDWSPQFVDLYYHADVRSLQSSARSVNAGSPSKHSYKTNSISSISPVPKDTPKQRRKSRQENFKVISLPVSQDMDTESHDECKSRHTLHHNVSFTPSGRSPNKSDNEGAEENRVNAYISNYLSSLSQGEPSCPLYIRRRLRPHYDQCDDQTDQRALIFPQLGLLSPAVSDPTVNNWNLANDRYASEQNQQKYHFSNMCSSCRERFEEQPVWIDNFQERTLTPTKYRQEAFKKQADNSGQHSRGYQAGDPNSRNVYSSFGGDNCSVGNIQGERTLTPTKYRTYMRPAQTMGRQMFISGRTYLSDVCNQANSEWERRDGKSQRQWLQGNFWPIENYDLNPVPPYCTPCQCLCCTTHDMGISTSSAPYLKRRRKCIRLDGSGWHDVRNSKTRLSQTGKLQQEQETQTPDSEQTSEFRFSTQMPTAHENQTSHYSNENISNHLHHSPFQQHFNSQSLNQSVNQSVNQLVSPSKESSSLQSGHPEALPSPDSLSQGQDTPAAQIMISKLNDSKISTLEQDMQNTQNSKHDCSIQSEKQPVIRVDVSEYITPVTTPTHQKSENNESNCTEFKNSLEKHEVKTDIEEANKTQQKTHKELPPIHQGTPEKGEGGNQPSGMRRQSTVDTLDSGITEDGLHCHPTIYINDNYESVVSDLEDNFNIPLYIPSL
ncbi:serine-rich adhesin for platelets [Biomphalaria glabrata]|nr:serine-rich adhesin for platelets [Biomphalaria glabrata]